MCAQLHNAAVDVIVTAHNMESCIGACLDSLERQTFESLRVVVVEDGSTDGTAAIAQDFAARHARFSVISTGGLGAGGARNRGMQEVRAPYFMILDGDDVFHPDMVEALHHAAIDGGADIAICDMQEMDDATGALTHPLWALKQSQLPAEGAFDGWRDMDGNIFAAFMGWPWDKLYRTEFVRGRGLSFPEDLPNSEDVVFTYQALVLAKRLAVANRVLVDHRMGRGSTVSSSRERAPLAFYDAICRVKAFLREQPDDTWEKLQRDYLSWAFDWTLWNIETMPDEGTRRMMARTLHDGALEALELEKHPASFFAGYPRSMQRYATLMTWLDVESHDNGPLGRLDALPYGAYKFWDFMNPAQKALAAWRERHPKPSEW